MRKIWPGHVAHMEETRGAHRVLVEYFEGNKNYLEDLGVGWRMMLKSVFKKWDGGIVWVDLAQDRGR